MWDSDQGWWALSAASEGGVAQSGCPTSAFLCSPQRPTAAELLRQSGVVSVSPRWQVQRAAASAALGPPAEVPVGLAAMCAVPMHPALWKARQVLWEAVAPPASGVAGASAYTNASIVDGREPLLARAVWTAILVDAPGRVVGEAGGPVHGLQSAPRAEKVRQGRCRWEGTATAPGRRGTCATVQPDGRAVPAGRRRGIPGWCGCYHGWVPAH